jgi:very-short-patch-repair endonuclease
MKKHIIQHDNSMYYGAPLGSFIKAAYLRDNMTETEQKLWEILKNGKFLGLKFRRQHPIGLYIADFYCHKLKVVIEVDGEYHKWENQALNDIKRTQDLNDLGIKVIRFNNQDILHNLEDVLFQLENQLSSFLNNNSSK